MAHRKSSNLCMMIGRCHQGQNYECGFFCMWILCVFYFALVWWSLSADVLVSWWAVSVSGASLTAGRLTLVNGSVWSATCNKWQGISHSWLHTYTQLGAVHLPTVGGWGSTHSCGLCTYTPTGGCGSTHSWGLRVYTQLAAVHLYNYVYTHLGATDLHTAGGCVSTHSWRLWNYIPLEAAVLQTAGGCSPANSFGLLSCRQLGAPHPHPDEGCGCRCAPAPAPSFTQLGAVHLPTAAHGLVGLPSLCMLNYYIVINSTNKLQLIIHFRAFVSFHFLYNKFMINLWLNLISNFFSINIKSFWLLSYESWVIFCNFVAKCIIIYNLCLKQYIFLLRLNSFSGNATKCGWWHQLPPPMTGIKVVNFTSN